MKLKLGTLKSIVRETLLLEASCPTCGDKESKAKITTVIEKAPIGWENKLAVWIKDPLAASYTVFVPQGKTEFKMGHGVWVKIIDDDTGPDLDAEVTAGPTKEIWSWIGFRCYNSDRHP